MPKDEMVRYTKNPSLATSLIHMHDPENVNLACSIFKVCCLWDWRIMSWLFCCQIIQDLCKFLRGDLKPDQINLTIQSIIAYGLERTELRDEIYCQIIRQLTGNPKLEQVVRGWHLLCLCVVAFPPNKPLSKVIPEWLNQIQTVVPILGARDPLQELSRNGHYNCQIENTYINWWSLIFR